MEAIFSSLWMLGNEMGIYVLAGLLAAGVLHQFVSESSVRKHLGQADTKSVYKAALVGTPLPLCSCSVIPFAVSLRKSGASKGSTLSFLISTPITGIDSILATFGMFGWAFTLYRVVSSVLIAIGAGMLMNRYDDDVVSVAPKPAFSLNPGIKTSAPLQFTTPAAPAKEPFSWQKVFSYGFGTLLGSFAKPMAWGLVIGAFITAAFPADLLHSLGENRWIGYVAAVAIATPMYVCATASLPIAASLMMAGISPGAALVFLSAGPATNTVTMGIVKAELGSRALAVYLGVIVAGSVISGALIDLIFDRLNVLVAHQTHEHFSLLSQGGAALLFGLIGWHLISTMLRKKSPSCSGGSCCS